jgi:hypothetical protein
MAGGGFARKNSVIGGLSLVKRDRPTLESRLPLLTKSPCRVVYTFDILLWLPLEVQKEAIFTNTFILNGHLFFSRNLS